MIAISRQTGKTRLLQTVWSAFKEKADHTKRHHRCWCGSGKLNKNCCKEFNWPNPQPIRGHSIKQVIVDEH